MFKVGIIGCGKIAQIRHIPEYMDNKDAKIVAFYDSKKNRAEELAVKYSAKSYSSYQEILEDPEIDAVSICTANHVHAEMTIAALKAGKHVLCEKPMATSREDCVQMVETARKTAKILLVGHNQRFTKSHQKAKELLKNNIIGDIITFKSNFGHRGPETWSIDPGKDVWFFDKNKAAMGSLADLGIHKTDLIHFLTDEVIVETTAKVLTLDKKDSKGNLIAVDDNAICIYRLSNGIIGTMTCSWNYYGPEDNSTIIYGTKGIMYIYDDPQYSIKVVLKDGEKIYYDIDQIQTNDKQIKSGVIDHFIHCLIKKEAYKISGEEALKAMRAIFASIESSQKEQSIKINQDY